MTNHTAMLEAVADDIYKRAMNHNKFSVDPEAVLFQVKEDVKHDFKQVKWVDEIRPPLEVRTALHDFRCRILALRPRERNDAELGRIEEQLLTERTDPLHYQKSTGKNGQAER